MANILGPEHPPPQKALTFTKLGPEHTGFSVIKVSGFWRRNNVVQV